VPVGESTLSFEVASDFNKTQIKNQKSSSSILPPAVLFDPAQVTLVEEGQPRQHHVPGATLRHRGWGANVRFNYFGQVAGEGFTPGFKETWGGQWLTDASLTVPRVNDKLSQTVGRLNVLRLPRQLGPPSGRFPFPSLASSTVGRRCPSGSTVVTTTPGSVCAYRTDLAAQGTPSRASSYYVTKEGHPWHSWRCCWWGWVSS
jgi:hypothetical protein